MTNVTQSNFSFLIAYLTPGFAVVVLLSVRFDVLRELLGGHGSLPQTVGGFMYATLASIMAGVTLGAVRWLLLERFHRWTGIQSPARDFSALHERRETFQYLVEAHYRFFEFYGNMFFVTLLALANAEPLTTLLDLPALLTTTLLVAAATLYFIASRDALRKYYERTEAVLQR